MAQDQEGDHGLRDRERPQLVVADQLDDGRSILALSCEKQMSGNLQRERDQQTEQT